MNLRAGMVLVQILDGEGGGPVVRADVIVEGSIVAQFAIPLAPELLDPRDDIASVATRAADAMIAIVRTMPPYETPPKPKQAGSAATVNVAVQNIETADPGRFLDDMLHAFHGHPKP